MARRGPAAMPEVFSANRKVVKKRCSIAHNKPRSPPHFTSRRDQLWFGQAVTPMAIIWVQVPEQPMTRRRFEREENNATKQEGNTETHTSRDEEEYDRDSAKTEKLKKEPIGGKEPR